VENNHASWSVGQYIWGRVLNGRRKSGKGGGLWEGGARAVLTARWGETRSRRRVSAIVGKASKARQQRGKHD